MFGTPRQARALLGLAFALLWGATDASAESSFLFEPPVQMGSVPAATYDHAGKRIGAANLIMERLDAGRVRMLSQSGQTGGARTLASAELAVEPKGLRLLRQESRSLDPEGRPLGSLIVDHAAAKASCLDANGKPAGEVSLPQQDRVVNVPMNLLFMPLVRGERETLQFQLFLCRQGGARLMDFEAWIAGDSSASGRTRHAVEVRYRPDFGDLVSIVARNFAPRLSFWFEPNAPHDWVAHRLPLYSGGPEVLVIRDGIPTASLVD